MTILVTGGAGFIGFHLARALLSHGARVVGLDNLNDYYDVSLKQARLRELETFETFRFARLDLTDRAGLEAEFAREKFATVVHLAAQAGVRYSLENPQAYVASNLEGFVNILECCRGHAVGHLVYASSSSVYGARTQVPFAEHEATDHPISLYGATKKANELIAHSYSHLFGIPSTGLRFFTVYGPWGRPDMAIFLFTKAILDGTPIRIFNHGEMQRDFTYVDDIVEGIVRVIDRVPTGGRAQPGATPESTTQVPHRIYNIGNHRPERLMHVIDVLERCIGREALKEFLPMQAGDVPTTCADVSALMADTGFAPDTPIEVGVERFVRWYRDYYGV